MLFVFFLQLVHEHHVRRSHFLSKPNISGFYFFCTQLFANCASKMSHHQSRFGIRLCLYSFPDHDLLGCSKTTEHQGAAGEVVGSNSKAAQSSAERQGAALPRQPRTSNCQLSGSSTERTNMFLE